MYASFLWISEALHLGIFHQPFRSCFFDSLVIDLDDQIILIFNQQALSLMAIIGRLALP